MALKTSAESTRQKVEMLNYTDTTFNIVQFRLRLIVLFSCSIGITIVTYFLEDRLKNNNKWYYYKLFI